MDEVDVDRLRAHADRRPVAIPDIQGEISGALGNLDEMFARAGPDAEYPEDVTLITEAARDAVGRLSLAVYKAEEGPLAQPVAPDGHYELVPLAWAHLEAADLIQLGLAVQDMGRAWAARSEDPIVDVLQDLAEVHRKPEDLVAEAARLHGLLSLPWDATVSTLFATLPPGAGRVVLDGPTHAAYERLVDRILGIWHAGDVLAPILYRGWS